MNIANTKMKIMSKLRNRRVGSIKASMGPAYTLIGLAIALAVVGVVAALSILPSGVSAGLASASLQIAGFLVLIGLGIAVGILEKTFGGK